MTGVFILAFALFFNCQAVYAAQSETRIGRVSASIIMIILLPWFGYFIAKLSSDLTMQSLKANKNGLEDLQGRRVAVVGGTTSYEYMQKERAYIESFDTVEED